MKEILDEHYTLRCSQSFIKAIEKGAKRNKVKIGDYVRALVEYGELQKIKFK